MLVYSSLQKYVQPQGKTCFPGPTSIFEIQSAMKSTSMQVNTNQLPNKNTNDNQLTSQTKMNQPLGQPSPRRNHHGILGIWVAVLHQLMT